MPDQPPATGAALRKIFADIDNTLAQLAARRTGARDTALIDTEAIADDAIGLYLEYRNQHGHDEESAKRCAIRDVVEGAAETMPESEPDDADPWLSGLSGPPSAAEVVFSAAQDAGIDIDVTELGDGTLLTVRAAVAMAHRLPGDALVLIHQHDGSARPMQDATLDHTRDGQPVLRLYVAEVGQ